MNVGENVGSNVVGILSNVHYSVGTNVVGTLSKLCNIDVFDRSSIVP